MHDPPAQSLPIGRCPGVVLAASPHIIRSCAVPRSFPATAKIRHCKGMSQSCTLCVGQPLGRGWQERFDSDPFCPMGRQNASSPFKHATWLPIAGGLVVSIDRQTDRNQCLTSITVHGAPAVADICNALDQFYAEHPTTFVMWDFTNADVSALSADDLRKIVSHARSLAPQRPGGRTALVVRDDHAYAISRMYEILSDVHEHPIQHGVFRSRNEALQWLLEHTNEPSG